MPCFHDRPWLGYFSRSPVTVVCMGHRVRARISRRARHGSLRLLSARRGRIRLLYRPRGRYTGRDSFRLRVRSPGRRTISHRVRLSVEELKLRALGDSVTAGFGYIGATPMTEGQFFDCIPPTQLNDQCSSNSSNGPSSTATSPTYLSDFGLSNGVAWPTQFASSAGVPASMYENRAVSGATPTDWASGQLNGQLETIVAASPNLTVLTLGANPLLDTFIGGGGLSCDQIEDPTLFKDCVQAFVTQAGLQPNLQSVLRQLLKAPANKVVVSQYHLAMPALALVDFTPRQLELMFGVLNSNVREAVQGVSGYGTRLFLMAPPRFNTGLPGGKVTCPGQSFTVDGPSRQAQISQQQLAKQPQFCPSSEYWVISADFGIHPSKDGHAQFAQALASLVGAHDLLPPLPP